MNSYKPTRYFKRVDDSGYWTKVIYFKYEEDRWYMWLTVNAMWFIVPKFPIGDIIDCSKEEMNEVTSKIF